MLFPTIIEKRQLERLCATAKKKLSHAGVSSFRNGTLNVIVTPEIPAPPARATRPEPENVVGIGVPVKSSDVLSLLKSSEVGEKLNPR